jgi:hypothetical protein
MGYFVIGLILFVLVYGTVATFVKKQRTQFTWYDLDSDNSVDYDGQIHRLRSNIMYLITSDPLFSPKIERVLKTWVVLKNGEVSFTSRVREPDVQGKWMELFASFGRGTTEQAYHLVDSHLQSPYIAECLRSPDCQKDLAQFSQS